jgi:hypothetical protein
MGAMNSREKATLIWLAIVLAGCLLKAEIRGSLWALVKAFFSPKIIGPTVTLAAWTVGMCAVGHRVGLWKTDVRNDTVVWFATVGFAFFFSLEKVSAGGFFRTTARRAIAVTVFVEAFANLAVLPLVLELLLLPVAAFLAAMAAVSETRAELLPVRRLVSGILGAIGILLLLYGVIELAGHFDVGHTFRTLALPVWLTFGVMPFIYIVGLRSAYETAFALIDIRTDDRTQRKRAKQALRRTARWNAPQLSGFAGHWIGDLVQAGSDDAAHRVMDEWRTTWRAERHADRLRDARTFMTDWLAQSDSVLRDLHADVLRGAWERLDSAQRAKLKAEGLQLAPPPLVGDVRALPD